MANAHSNAIEREREREDYQKGLGFSGKKRKQ